MNQNEKLNLEEFDDATISRLESLANETVKQILPYLWQKLNSGLNQKIPFPEELGDLLGQRLCFEAFDFYVWIELLKRKPNQIEADKDFLKGIEQVMQPGIEHHWCNVSTIFF